MNSLREIVDGSPKLRGLTMKLGHTLRGEEGPQTLGPAQWDWQSTQKILLVRLRSIGDAVLVTPSLYALKRFLPHARVDILLEDWVAPVLEGFAYVDNVIPLQRGSVAARARVAGEIRAARYDVVYNLHGGTTATFLTRATGAKHRVGYATYQYARLHNHLSPSPLALWGKAKAHSVEQQLALLGWTGVPVTDRPATNLKATPEAAAAIASRLESAGLREGRPFALIHPGASFATKQWAVDNFARVIEALAARDISAVAIAPPNETALTEQLQQTAKDPIVAFNDLSLPEVTALCSRARVFVGNDSGIAHIAAAVGAPSVVIFGSSNRAHWQPWATAPAEVVFEELPCQPCHGYFCEKFQQPECIIRVPVERVVSAVERVLRNS